MTSGDTLTLILIATTLAWSISWEIESRKREERKRAWDALSDREKTSRRIQAETEAKVETAPARGAAADERAFRTYDKYRDQVEAYHREWRRDG